MKNRAACNSYNVQYRLRSPNAWDRMLKRDTYLWNQIQLAGGIMAVVSPFRARLLGVGNWGEPWMRMPADGKKFQFVNSVEVAPFDGIDRIVLTFQVPPGYDGVISGLTQLYTGGGFVEGSGDLTWRLKLNQVYPQSLGTMLTSMGSLQTPSPFGPGGLRIQSRQVVNYIVNVLPAAAARLDAAARIVCVADGWFYPQQ
jgi:hypothetical protein